MIYVFIIIRKFLILQMLACFDMTLGWGLKCFDYIRVFRKPEKSFRKFEYSFDTKTARIMIPITIKMTNATYRIFFFYPLLQKHSGRSIRIICESLPARNQNLQNLTSDDPICLLLLWWVRLFEICANHGHDSQKLKKRNLAYLAS